MTVYSLLSTLLALKELTRRLFARDWKALSARLGRVGPPNAGPRVWLHAASNGEIASAKPVIEHLLHNGIRLLVTVNTDSAVRLVQSWELRGLDVLLAPIDLRGPAKRVYEKWDITAHIALESDLWPVRILACPGPVIVLGGRLTERSAAGWKRFEPLTRRVVGTIDYLSAQDSASRERIAAFGLRSEANGPVFDLKALYTAKDETPDQILRAAFERANTWLAASTHEGDDEIVLMAHKTARQRRPDLKLILAPRHPKRADAIAALAEQNSLTVTRRSQDANPRNCDVYLADTLGEMHLWYALAGVTLVAGSFSNKGGHTPYEPAAFASAILHGPDTANFTAAYARLHAANAAIQVATADELADALVALANPEIQRQRGLAAQKALQQDADLESLMRDVIAVLDA